MSEEVFSVENLSSLPSKHKEPALRPRPAILHVSPEAVARIRTMISGRRKPTYGIRVGIRSRGCSGLSYTLEFADTPGPLDETVEVEDIRILIDPKAVMFLIGAEMHYVETRLSSGFTFTNPNEKGRCGCGESFHA